MVRHVASRGGERRRPCPRLAAILNGPLANAYLAVHSPSKGIRVSALKAIPLPARRPDVLDLVNEYCRLIADVELLAERDRRLLDVLIEIDARVLAAYDLPPRLETHLLKFFDTAERPVAHEWCNWNSLYPETSLTLAERLSGRFRTNENWVSNVFKPLPVKEARLLRAYGV